MSSRVARSASIPGCGRADRAIASRRPVIPRCTRWPSCPARVAGSTPARRRAGRSPSWPSTIARTCAASCIPRHPRPRPTTRWSPSSGPSCGRWRRIATGTLLDPEIGAAQAIADGSLPGGAGLLVAVEATGYEGPSTARVSRILPGWSVEQAKRMGASAAKLLVYYHPAAANAADQERLVAEVAAGLRPVRPAAVRRAARLRPDDGRQAHRRGAPGVRRRDRPTPDDPRR